jgi:hypothetical protein
LCAALAEGRSQRIGKPCVHIPSTAPCSAFSWPRQKFERLVARRRQRRQAFGKMRSRT